MTVLFVLSVLSVVAGVIGFVTALIRNGLGFSSTSSVTSTSVWIAVCGAVGLAGLRCAEVDGYVGLSLMSLNLSLPLLLYLVTAVALYLGTGFVAITLVALALLRLCRAEWTRALVQSVGGLLVAALCASAWWWATS